MAQSKRVLFIERNLRNEKLGVMYLSAALKAAGHDADLIQTDKQDLDQRIGDYRPDFVAFSISTGEHGYAARTARRVKRQYNIPNIVGGPHSTFFPEIGFEPGLDFIVQGQGERAIVDVVEGRVQPGLYKAPMADHLDAFPFPDREIFYQFEDFRANPMKNVITSRACPYKCAYCFNHSQYELTRIDGETKQWFDRRSVENVVAEINKIKEHYPLEKILFIDDSFIQSRNWLHEFLEAYTERARLPWLCSLRVNCLDEKLAEKMFESGLEMINYAMESADPDVQQRLLNRGHISNADVIRAIALFDRFGVRARMQNMIGLPLDNPLEDALNTLQFNMRHRVTDSWCSIFQPYPRTALGQYCVDHGYCDMDQLQNCSESFFDESRLNIRDKEALFLLQKLWYFIIDARLSLDVVQTLIRGRCSQELADALQRLRFRCSRKKLYGIDGAEVATAIDLQSRERTESRSRLPAEGSERRALLRAVFNGAAVDDAFVDLVSRIDFGPEQLEALRKHADGVRVHPDPIYTIDDATGELIDANESIYTRGTAGADRADIRRMPEDHFMRDMAGIRDALQGGVSSAVASAEAIGESDERHLNQFLA